MIIKPVIVFVVGIDDTQSFMTLFRQVSAACVTAAVYFSLYMCVFSQEHR